MQEQLLVKRKIEVGNKYIADNYCTIQECVFIITTYES